MRKPEKGEFLFFWGGVFSNFYPINGDAVTSEHFYMEAKALFFNDFKTATLIRTAQSPREAKKLGRQVANFDEKEWDSYKEVAMRAALSLKLVMCKKFRDALRDSEGKTLVEASPTDKIWGIGFKEADAMDSIDRWGQNLLGECLMEIRYRHFGF